MRKREPSNKTQSEMIFTTNQLAELLNVTPRRVQQLAEDGTLVKSERGKYKAFESIQNYIKSIQGKQGDGNTDVDYFNERALHEKAKREIAEIELSVMRGDLHRSQDVKYVMNDMLAAFRSRMLALPAKLSPQLLGKNKLPVINSLLTSEIREALKELSEYDPQAFYAKSEEYVELSDDEDSE
ncbi:hypothetical protein [Paenibacillus sp. UNC451MF]|uniref:hypothetical protein n=1 Tax=Paenibacillus sp. UNC451MF TaxID=1449063 RepID=UPI000562E4FB|nr:hypothetical protein [Paenibacillus sp. UNC451MF]